MIRTVLVDDAASYRQLVRLVLEDDGNFEVVGEADDGARGIEVVAEERPDLVLLDLSMPVMDGVEALPFLREASPRSNVIVLTGFEVDAVGDLREAGARAVLEKGLDPVALVDRIRSELDGAAERTPA